MPLKTNKELVHLSVNYSCFNICGYVILLHISINGLHIQSNESSHTHTHTHTYIYDEPKIRKQIRKFLLSYLFFD